VAAKKQYKDFESALKRLEEITELMESGDVSLEASIDLYTEGLEIAKYCNNKLAEAEKKIKIIKEKGGMLVEQEFEESEAKSETD
jgi:exodeoxyribonuclease VII small subunit